MGLRGSSKLSTNQQNDLLSFLSSASVPVVGNYTVGKVIGEGSFGKVKLARHKLTGQQASITRHSTLIQKPLSVLHLTYGSYPTAVAIKIVDKIHAPALVREIETWRQMRHPNIAQLYEVLCSESKIYMVMEYCDGGEMFDYIVKHGRLDDQGPECRRIFKQIIDAVTACHEKNFVHRDLKLENILMTEDLDVKLIDFGFTRDYENTKLLDTYCGSSAYAAPEIVTGKKYSGVEADVWSLGVILFTLVCGYLPFDEENDIIVHKKIAELDYELPDFLSEGGHSKDLISRFLKINPAERIAISDVFKHPWFTKHNSAQLQLVSPVGGETLLAGTKEEMILAAQLEALGFDVPTILESVHSNACDQACALWYLLLKRGHRVQSHASTPSILDAENSAPSLASTSNDASPLSDTPSQAGPTSEKSPSSSGSITPKEASNGMPTSLQLNVDIEKYFTHARQKSATPSENPLLNFASTSFLSDGSTGSAGSVASSTFSPVVTPTVSSVRGRRGILMETMRSSGSPPMTSSSTSTTPTSLMEQSRPRSSGSQRYPLGNGTHSTPTSLPSSPKRNRPTASAPSTGSKLASRAPVTAVHTPAEIAEESEPDEGSVQC
eukprot:jgi/Hompol1/684/HPOL_000805-RA